MRKHHLAIAAVLLSVSVVPGAWAQANYAAGQSYTADPPLRTDWLGDSGGELTDGVTDWGWDPVTGWDGSFSSNPRSLVIDLGEVKGDIGTVAVTVFVSAGSAVAPQKQVLVLGSSTSESEGFVEWGEAVTQDAGDEDNRVYTWAAGPVSARWVKVILDSETPGFHSLLSEIAVLQQDDSTGGGDIPPIDTEGQTNYAAGQPYSADPPFRTDWLGDAGGELTDGVTDWAWDPVTGWDGSFSANPRSIVVDLGGVKDDIGAVVVTVFVSLSSAVAPQLQILVLGSSTSESEGFVEWGEAVTQDAGEEDNRVHAWAGGPAAARWVKIVLDSETPGFHSLLSEIQVLQAAGTSAVTDWALYE